MEDIFKIFGLARLQDVIATVDYVYSKGYDLNQLKKSVTQRILELHKNIGGKKFLKCPKCGKPLTLLKLNTSKANQIEGYKCVASCSDMLKCGYEKYYKESIDEVFKSLIEKEKEENGN